MQEIKPIIIKHEDNVGEIKMTSNIYKGSPTCKLTIEIGGQSVTIDKPAIMSLRYKLKKFIDAVHKSKF